MFPGQQANGPLTAPGQDQPASDNTGQGVAPQAAVADPNEMGKRMITDIIVAARRLGVKYPNLMSEVREVTQNLAPRMLQKLVQSQPSPEPMAPPV